MGPLPDAPLYPSIQDPDLLSLQSMVGPERRQAGRNLVHHSGGVDGFSANIDRYMDVGMSFIVLCNIENLTAVLLTDALAEAYFAQN